ncbi:hypothetical protein ACT4ML_07515 [Natrinema sp. LN54]|uniref:hypothetical protein n=1 Tax=Natrinema sp. LN54 TaxID=3458705 RepID=UPI004036E4D0
MSVFLFQPKHGDVTGLEEYYGTLTDETATELERIISERREDRSRSHRVRVRRIVTALE